MKKLSYRSKPSLLEELTHQRKKKGPREHETHYPGFEFLEDLAIDEDPYGMWDDEELQQETGENASG